MRSPGISALVCLVLICACAPRPADLGTRTAPPSEPADTCRSTHVVAVRVSSAGVTVRPRSIDVQPNDCIRLDITEGRLEELRFDRSSGAADLTRTVDLSRCRTIGGGWCEASMFLAPGPNPYHLTIRDVSGIVRTNPDGIQINPPTPCVMPNCQPPIPVRLQIPRPPT